MSDIIWAAAILGSGLFGAAAAELVHRRDIRKLQRGQRRDALIAEYFARQCWQFLSIDEWLKGNGYE